MTSAWRQRCTAAQTRGLTIERQADGLRRALVGLAGGGPETADDVQRAVTAIREQLVIAERLADLLAEGRVP
jgi:hypothetical protein